jgi:hypothetical protein
VRRSEQLANVCPAVPPALAGSNQHRSEPQPRSWRVAGRLLPLGGTPAFMMLRDRRASTELRDQLGANTRTDRFAGAVDDRVVVVQDGGEVGSGEDCAELERELIRVCSPQVGGGMGVPGGLR